jgi:polyhydroxyalkanoate synthase subunit PhaC
MSAMNEVTTLVPAKTPAPPIKTAKAIPSTQTERTQLPVADENVGSEGFRAIDRVYDSLIAKRTGGLSPEALALAFLDWSMHLASAPGKQIELVEKALRKSARFAAYALAASSRSGAPQCIEPLPGDNRFRAPAWQKQPYNLLAQSFLLTQQWWHNVTHEVPGVTPRHEDMVSFTARQLLDVFSPSNIPFADPEVIEKALNTGGTNFIKGVQNWMEDLGRLCLGQPPVGTEKFRVGHDIAVTPGKVVYRNQLIELIQYSPATDKALAEPVLIVPAWIMKYYILDLSPHNSLVRYLVGKGHTVFCISWHNPTAQDRDLKLHDYRQLGVMRAIDAIGAIVPDRKIHAAGYCLGGTILSIAAAAMARASDERLASVTLFAAQTDFSEPGELALFINHSQMHFLDSIMWDIGYLSAGQMAGAFALLRSNDLIWSRVVHEYLMGERTPMTDLMAWNADSTRLPHKMHSEYLQHLYLDNDLAAGRFVVDGRPAALQNLRVPMFVVGTERDHVAPWRSVYKIHYLADTDITFVLTNGGHNAGIVSEPDHPGRHFRIALKRTIDPCISPDEWVAAADSKNGSWWAAWEQWLSSHSAAERVPPPGMGAPKKGYPIIADAPGTYVFQG